ncbi:hypothetical protein GOP47_0008758 [Adiantum capillus-veneris]|uniref:Protein kinase domain-containing protein n=1 Tax=Adiantum capillus-veneris TaxID=13818 RepID=A0A9D4UZ66_ADICA|nr:hypothetical protein GOP47_0008758 [Adiantum capillus-veneris]
MVSYVNDYMYVDLLASTDGLQELHTLYTWTVFNKSGPVFPWAHRYKIVTGVVATVLAYLHEECEQQVVHRDVKASNIMLDARFNARLGDFGIAKVAYHNKSPDATLVVGTMGYLAPEYIHTGKASEKKDVFSYGVVVLEVACGWRPLETDVPSKENVLVDWVWGLDVLFKHF